MFKGILLFILLSCVFTLGDCNDQTLPSQTLSRLKTLASVLNNADTVIELKNDRLYLNPCKIIPTSHGLITYSQNSEEILLPELFSDEQGCFVYCHSQDIQTLIDGEEIRIWWCSTCKTFRNMDDHGRCTKCGRKL